MTDVNIAGRLKKALVAAGVAVADVSIGDATNRATWRVYPANLQGAAQLMIDAFNPDDPAYEQAELDAAVTHALDDERLSAAIVWAVIDTYSAPATPAKFQAARTKIVSAYKSRPWLP